MVRLQQGVRKVRTTCSRRSERGQMMSQVTCGSSRHTDETHTLGLYIHRKICTENQAFVMKPPSHLSPLLGAQSRLGELNCSFGVSLENAPQHPFSSHPACSGNYRAGNLMSTTPHKPETCTRVTEAKEKKEFSTKDRLLRTQALRV